MEIIFMFAKIGASVAAAGAAYLFIVTRLSLIIQDLFGKKDPANHVYWIYKNRFLIWLTDRQPIISAILLWNYHQLVKDVAQRLDLSSHGKDVLQLSCAFGNISEMIAKKCAEHDTRLVITDIIPGELAHAKRKLARRGLTENISFKQCDATALPYSDGSFDHVVSFFLFHELPLEKKRMALKESMRVLKPGGKLICAEFHLPDSWILRISGQVFFAVFERYAHEMWHTFDIEKEIHACAETKDRWTFSKRPVFNANYFSFEAYKTPQQ